MKFNVFFSSLISFLLACKRKEEQQSCSLVQMSNGGSGMIQSGPTASGQPSIIGPGTTILDGGVISGPGINNNNPSGAQGTTVTKNSNQPKKPRLVFTDLQRRTLQAIFKETKRPSKEMQITISQQLGLELSTVGNFFMNARRRSQDKWMEDPPSSSNENSSSSTTVINQNPHHHHPHSHPHHQQPQPHPHQTANSKNKPILSKQNQTINGSVPTSVLTMGSNVIVSCT